jgi:hypothetical protein
MSTDESQRKPSQVKPESTKPGNSAPPQSQSQHDDTPRKPLPFDDTSDEEKSSQLPDPQPGGGMFV